MLCKRVRMLTRVVGHIAVLSEAHGAVGQVDGFLAQQNEVGVEAVLLWHWVAHL